MIDNNSLLGQFLGSYFHPDWSLDHKSTEEIVDYYSTSESDYVVQRTYDELMNFIRESECLSDSDLNSYLFVVGAYFRNKYETRPALEWLEAIAKRLKYNMRDKRG